MVGCSLRVLGFFHHYIAGRHDIAEILLKVALKYPKSNTKKKQIKKSKSGLYLVFHPAKILHYML